MLAWPASAPPHDLYGPPGRYHRIEQVRLLASVFHKKPPPIDPRLVPKDLKSPFSPVVMIAPLAMWSTSIVSDRPRLTRRCFQGDAVVARNQDWIRTTRADADATPPAGRRRVLAKGNAAVEERGLAAFRTLEQSVRTDANLLNLTERPEVLRAVRADRDAFVAALKSALTATGDARQAFREVAIEKPFDVYLKQHPFVMELAGAVLVEPESGQWLLIGVGKTLLKDDSVEELLRAEKVCTLKARAAAIGERDGSVITHFKRVEDRILVVTDDAGREKAVAVSERLKITQEKVEGIAKNLPVVGRWRSENGKQFYLAVGGKIPADLLPKRE
jgi:hypothetical protein